MNTPGDLLALAMQHHRNGRLMEAETIYRQVLTQSPRQPDALHLLGVLAYQRGHLELASDLIRQAIGLHDTNPDYHNNLGLVVQARGDLPDAITCYETALRLKPDFAASLNNLGNALKAQERLAEAEKAYRKAIQLDPHHVDAQVNLGDLLARQHRPDEAITCYRQAIAINPRSVEAYSGLRQVHLSMARALTQEGRFDEGVTSCRKALEIDPASDDAKHLLGYLYLNQGDLDQAIACCHEILARRPDDAQAHQILMFALLRRSASTAQEIFNAHRRFGAVLESPFINIRRVHANDRAPERRLKIGYVSPDFRDHSVARFIEPIIAHHDRHQLELYGYYSRPTADAVTERFQAHVDHWLPCSGISDDELAKRIEQDGIDILIDLAGHTGDNRLAVFARKPAPIQVTYLGYPTTTGLTSIDYRLTTEDTDPDGSERWHTEQLYRLPHALWCYRSPFGSVEATTPPALTVGKVTFGSMNSFSKISPETVSVWAAILRAVPRSRLIMTLVPEGSARRQLLDRFAAHSVNEDRLVFYGRPPVDQFRILSREIDIALDPFPYNGTTTTCDALWMGIPVVTRIGKTSVARSGYALLKTVGLSALCANDEAEYVKIATNLATDLPHLSKLREEMKQRIGNSPLSDTAALTRDIEQAYRAMWRKWCTRIYK